MGAKRRRSGRVAFWVSGIYFLAAGVWVAFSERVMEAFSPGPSLLTRVGQAKDWLLISATSIILFRVLQGRHVLKDRHDLARTPGAPEDGRQGDASLSWIDEGRFDERLLLYYQPVVHLPTGDVEYYEILLRARRHDGTIALPGEFIPQAEERGVMPEIDLWVIEKAFDLLKADAKLKLFVNLSVTSLESDLIPNRVEERLARDPIEPGRLILELTETAPVRNWQRVQATIQRLSRSGCSFALDDFGTGYSTFSHLQNVPADWVKIDGTFVHRLDSDTTNRAIVDAIKTMADALGKKVVAEWVEDPRLVAALTDLGVEYAQGYHWGRPSPYLRPL